MRCNSSDGSMRHPPSDLALKVGIAPLRMIAAQRIAKRLPGKPPQAEANGKTLRRRFIAQDCSHSVIHYLILELVVTMSRVVFQRELHVACQARPPEFIEQRTIPLAVFYKKRASDFQCGKPTA